ncbi:11748_t:CDS:2, partial [Funneliformis geosporum]
NFSIPTDMEVENTSTSIPNDKGKAPENIILSVNKETLDYDQSFDVAENILDKNNGNNAFHFKRETGGYTLDDSIHTSGPWADETEKDIVRHQNKYQPSQFDAILIQINNVSQQLADIYNNLAFTLTRINMIEAVLNISSILPKQAKIINSNPLKDPIDEMDEDLDQNDIIMAGIDISKSIIRQQKAQTYNALAAVAQMQRMLIHHEMMPQDRLIPIMELVKSALSSFYNNKNYK